MQWVKLISQCICKFKKHKSRVQSTDHCLFLKESLRSVPYLIDTGLNTLLEVFVVWRAEIQSYYLCLSTWKLVSFQWHIFSCHLDELYSPWWESCFHWHIFLSAVSESLWWSWKLFWSDSSLSSLTLHLLLFPVYVDTRVVMIMQFQKLIPMEFHISWYQHQHHSKNSDQHNSLF